MVAARRRPARPGRGWRAADCPPRPPTTRRRGAVAHRRYRAARRTSTSIEPTMVWRTQFEAPLRVATVRHRHNATRKVFQTLLTAKIDGRSWRESGKAKSGCRRERSHDEDRRARDDGPAQAAPSHSSTPAPTIAIARAGPARGLGTAEYDAPSCSTSCGRSGDGLRGHRQR